MIYRGYESYDSGLQPSRGKAPSENMKNISGRIGKSPTLPTEGRECHERGGGLTLHITQVKVFHFATVVDLGHRAIQKQGKQQKRAGWWSGMVKFLCKERELKWQQLAEFGILFWCFARANFRKRPPPLPPLIISKQPGLKPCSFLGGKETVGGCRCGRWRFIQPFQTTAAAVAILLNYTVFFNFLSVLWGAFGSEQITNFNFVRDITVWIWERFKWEGLQN